MVISITVKKNVWGYYMIGSAREKELKNKITTTTAGTNVHLQTAYSLLQAYEKFNPVTSSVSAVVKNGERNTPPKVKNKPKVEDNLKTVFNTGQVKTNQIKNFDLF